ncbi:MAG: 2-dehydropantoate 2-reductase [Syntrophales bacterium]|nr:2-dehydropantoate 2-reductase [Syntrophales bacterium]
MKIAVLGAGAMGCLYGALLAEAGESVTLLDVWEAHIQMIRERGLTITSPNGDRNFPLQAETDPRAIGKVDLVIVFVKSYHTREAMKGALSLLGEETIVFTVQNGLGNVEQLAEIAGEKRILAGTSGFGATMIAPGHIRHAGTGATTFGEPSGLKTARIEQLRAIFETAGLNPVIAENLPGIIWGKLLVNVGINPITALARIKNGQILEIPELTELMEKAVGEALEVSRRRGIRLAFAGDPLEHVKAVMSNTKENISSMRQDIERGRRTEIDFINGAIVREGAALGVPTPVNFTLTSLIKGLEEGARQKK